MEIQKDISWEAYEYKHRHKRADWYWSVGIISISIIVTAIFLNNILFAMVVLLGTFSLLLYAYRTPKRIKCSLTSKGIHIDKTFFPHTNLDSFWVEDRTGDAKIIIKSKHILAPFIIVPIEGVSSEKIQNYLLEHLYEEEHQEPLSQKIMEILGF